MQTTLSTAERDAIGHAAAALGGHLRRVVEQSTEIRISDGRFLSEQLCHYRVACELSGQTPAHAIVDLVETAIAEAEQAAA